MNLFILLLCLISSLESSLKIEFVDKIDYTTPVQKTNPTCSDYSDICKICDKEKKELICNTFITFEELDFKRGLDFRLNSLTIEPLEPLTLNSNLKIHGLDFENNFNFTIKNVDSMNIDSDIFSNLTKYKPNLIIAYARMEFKMNDSSFKDCPDDLVLKIKTRICFHHLYR